jgi:NADPH:quinone reductase-like Zn-dependent oxidoreductase
MKAIVYTEYGDPGVLRIQEVEKPVPKDDEVVVKIHTAAVNFGDLMARNFKNIPLKEFNMPLLLWIMARFMMGFSKPKNKILGNSFSGVIESTGRNVGKFRAGDAVFGYTGQNMGAYAEYLCLPETAILAQKPSNISFEEASAIPYGASMAICLLRKVNIKKDHKILVSGASGSIGSAAVQLAKNHFGADVTAVCSTHSVDFVKKLGIDKVIDYKKEDYTKNGEKYDIIFDILGKGSFSSVKKSLNPNGIYLLASFKTGKLLQMIRTSLSGGRKIVCALVSPKAWDLT